MTTTSNQERGVGVLTNGRGKTCTSHLNLTRSLADVAAQPSPPVPKMTERALPIQRPPYAGYDPTEQVWK